MKRITLIAVLVPVLGFGVLVARAEYASHHGPTWRVPIDGYDPRDLLSGQYLRYQYRWNWSGEHTCGAPERLPDVDFDSDPGTEPSPEPTPEPTLEPGCCLCLSRTNPDGIDPPVRQVWCEDDFEPCDARVRVDAVMPPQRYFIPEERAAELENALPSRRAELELTVGPDQRPAVRELWLDGQPWRAVLGETGPR